MAYRTEVWRQWDRQVNIPQAAYIEMNNLFLQIEREEVELTIHTGKQLRTLLGIVYPVDGNMWTENMRNYWMDSFIQLPGWNEV